MAIQTPQKRLPVRTTLVFKNFAIVLHPDRTDDFIDDLEKLCQKYAGENYSFQFNEEK